MSVPASTLKQLAGVPLSCMGPGLRNPMTLANIDGIKTLVLLRAALGQKCLQHWPFHPKGRPPKEERDALDAGEGVEWTNWSSEAPCILCSRGIGGIFHLTAECPHEVMVDLRPRLRRSMALHAKNLHRDLRNIISGEESLRRMHATTAEESDAFDALTSYLSHQEGGAEPPCAQPDPLDDHAELEVNLYTYRLLLAAPWARHNAAQGHGFAAALGGAFDCMLPEHVSDRMLRQPATNMVKWAVKWLHRVADAYRANHPDAGPPPPPPVGAPVA